MKKIRFFTAFLLAMALCLAGTAAPAEEEDFYEIEGVWYSEEVMMTVSEDGRFELGWNDGDWVGSLKPEQRTNEQGDEYTAFRMALDKPELSPWENLELVQDPYHPGKVTFFEDGSPVETFWDIPVYVMDMEGEDLGVYEPYTFIDTSEGDGEDEEEEYEEGPAVIMMFTLLQPAEDVAVMRMYDQEIDEDGNLGYNADTLEWWAALDSQERIVVKHVFEGDMPDLLISFAGDDETTCNYAVTISGEDGELELLPLLPSNG